MPILGPSATGYAPVQQATTTAQAVITDASNEVRQVIDSTVSSDQTLLLDWCNRAQLALLRASRWQFLLNGPFYFITQREQSDYWVGTVGQAPAGVVDTQLNLNNLDIVVRSGVRDVSNDQVLYKTSVKPFSLSISTKDAQFLPGLPAEWAQNLATPNIISVYPAPDNQNAWQPIPQTPYVQITPGGSLPSRTYQVMATFVDSLGFEGTPCQRPAIINVPASYLARANSPVLPYNVTASGVSYNRYNVYVSAIADPNASPSSTNNETLQNISPIALGTSWTEPTSGITTSGAVVPINNPNVQITTMDGYLIEFYYFEQRQTVENLTDVLQIPDVYKDIMVWGVTWYACQYLRLKDEAQYWFQMFQDGIRQMIKDRNLMPRENDYIGPDATGIGIGAGVPYQDFFGNPLS